MLSPRPEIKCLRFERQAQRSQTDKIDSISELEIIILSIGKTTSFIFTYLVFLTSVGESVFLQFASFFRQSTSCDK